ncbi:MAG: ribosome maturation factor RimM [Burkholderiaceae bacterium]|jgi:16S rRNA processing protein RimM|nr:ribosome maturation factor RimM [Burkholderiaceae bacterium]
MLPGAPLAQLPPDAVEVGRIADAWGVKGWFKVAPYSASAEALFSCKHWFLLPPERGSKAGSGSVALLQIKQARQHADTVVACAQDIADRAAAEALKGARIFIPRSSFPAPAQGEYYWVDLIGLAVVNRQGVALGRVRELLSNGAQDVLVVAEESAGPKPKERLIPFVDAWVDSVDMETRCITVDWQPDY